MAALPTSTRLTFRVWREDDLPLATSLWADADVMRYMGGPMSADEARGRLQLEIERERVLGIQYWPIFETASGEFAGCAGLRPFHDEVGVFEVGVHLMRRFWSARLGEEAARAVIRFALEELAVEGLTAGHHPENRHSQALLGRLGFTFSHVEPWGKMQLGHLFYRLSRRQNTEIPAAQE